MCGIAGIHRRTSKQVKQLNRLADALLLGIAHRGSDATGTLAIMDDGRTHVEKAAEACAQFVLSRKHLPAKARTVLLHTRYATRGAADDPRNAHPVVTGRAAAIHNGTIYNDADLFRRHRMERHADVDSVVIPALINKLGWSNANVALSALRGGAATAVVHQDHPTELILARVASYPMVVLVTDEVVVWASERKAIEQAWAKVYGGKPDGKWLVLDERTMLRFNGHMTIERLAPLPPVAPMPRTWKQASAPLPKPKPKKARKSKSGGQMTLRTATPPTPPAHERREPYMESAVQDLIDWTGCSYDEAYEAVYGVSPDEDTWTWDDDMIVTREQRRRDEGWQVGL